jgi:hypothetical protein
MKPGDLRIVTTHDEPMWKRGNIFLITKAHSKYNIDVVDFIFNDTLCRDTMLYIKSITTSLEES